MAHFAKQITGRKWFRRYTLTLLIIKSRCCMGSLSDEIHALLYTLTINGLVDLHSTYWHMTRWDHSTSKSAAKSSSKTTAKSPIHSRWEAQWWSRAGRTQQQQQGQQSDASLSSRACKQKRNSKLKLATCLLYFGVGAGMRATNPSCLITWGWSRRSPTKTPCSSSCGGKSCNVFCICTMYTATRRGVLGFTLVTLVTSQLESHH